MCSLVRFGWCCVFLLLLLVFDCWVGGVCDGGDLDVSHPPHHNHVSYIISHIS